MTQTMCPWIRSAGLVYWQITAPSPWSSPWTSSRWASLSRQRRSVRSRSTARGLTFFGAFLDCAHPLTVTQVLVVLLLAYFDHGWLCSNRVELLVYAHVAERDFPAGSLFRVACSRRCTHTARTGRSLQNGSASRTFYIPFNGLDTGLLTAACSCLNTHTQLSFILPRPPVSVTILVVAVASSSVRSIGVPLRVGLGLLEGVYGLFALLLGSPLVALNAFILVARCEVGLGGGGVRADQINKWKYFV